MSVPEREGTLQVLIAMADAINHALPTHQELQRGLGWLMHHGLVQKAGRNYLLTSNGAALLTRCGQPGQNKFDVWDAVASQLESMIGVEAPLDDVTIEEAKRADAAYRKDFAKQLRLLDKRDT